MHLHILGGNNISNESRIEELADSLNKELFSKISIQKYEHRKKTQIETLDIEGESRKLVESVKGLNTYAIAAKSVGCLIVLYAMKTYQIMPSKIYFIGFPLGFAVEALCRDLEIMLRHITYNREFHLIHQLHDPAGAPQEIEKLFDLSGHKTIGHFFEGESHFYEIDILQKYII